MKFTLTLHYIKVEADPARWGQPTPKNDHVHAIDVQTVYEVAQKFAELFALVGNFLIASCLNNLK